MSYIKPIPQDLRRVNRTEILRQIYFNGPISRLEVSQQIGISPATVTNIVNNLLQKEILIESGIKRSESGRPSTLISINPDYGYFIGIEVGETFVQVELFDIFLNSRMKSTTPLSQPQVVPQEIVMLMVEEIKWVVSNFGIKNENIIGVGIGFPGLVDPVKGVSVFTPNWGWHNVSITSQLREQLSIPVYLDNGAKAMAMGEALFGAGRGVNYLAVLLVGTGVGCGIVINSNIFRGYANNAGEFGHTTLNVDGPQCRCGSRGCMEVYLGANNIISRYVSLISENKPEIENQIDFVKYIISQANAGIPEAIQIVDETIKYLGVSIANVINVINPELLLLGGWSGLLFGGNYLDKIKLVVEQYALKQSLAKTKIGLCQLGYGSVSKGAASLVLEHFFKTPGDSESMIVGGRPIKAKNKK